MRAVVRASAAMVALFLTSASAATAQAVSGRLLETGSAQPVMGALVILLDADGSEITTTVTSAAGAYHVRAPGAGQFRLRVERIGFQTTTTDPITLLADETASLEIGQIDRRDLERAGRDQPPNVRGHDVVLGLGIGERPPERLPRGLRTVNTHHDLLHDSTIQGNPKAS